MKRKLQIKLPAYTLLEVILVMILIGIIMGMAYAVLNMVQSYQINISQKDEQQNEYFIASKAIQFDAEKSIYLKTAADSSLQCIQKDGQIIQYFVEDNQLTRTFSDNVDTLLKGNNLTIEFNFENSTIYPDLIQSAIISYQDSLNRKFYFTVKHHYSSEDLFKLSTDARN